MTRSPSSVSHINETSHRPVFVKGFSDGGRDVSKHYNGFNVYLDHLVCHIEVLVRTNEPTGTLARWQSGVGYFRPQNPRELAFDEVFKSRAQFVETFDPESVCPDAFQVIGHAVDRIDVSLSRAFRSLANLRGRLEGSV